MWTLFLERMAGLGHTDEAGNPVDGLQLGVRLPALLLLADLQHGLEQARI